MGAKSVLASKHFAGARCTLQQLVAAAVQVRTLAVPKHECESSRGSRARPDLLLRQAHGQLMHRYVVVILYGNERCPCACRDGVRNLKLNLTRHRKTGWLQLRSLRAPGKRTLRSAQSVATEQDTQASTEADKPEPGRTVRLVFGALWHGAQPAAVPHHPQAGHCEQSNA